MSSPSFEKETGANLAAQHDRSGVVTPSAFSVIDDKEKDHSPRISDVEARNGDLPSDLERVESSPYPKKFRLVSILVGLVLSIFLVALDMVSILIHIAF